MNQAKQVYQSLKEHYEETSDALGHIQYLIDRGASASDISYAYHKLYEQTSPNTSLVDKKEAR